MNKIQEAITKNAIKKETKTDTSYFENLEDKKQYSWIYDTIDVYVHDNFYGGGYKQEIPVINNSINDSIKSYKRTLGPGHWVEYLGPGKKHKNTSIKEATTNNKVRRITDENQYYDVLNKYGFKGPSGGFNGNYCDLIYLAQTSSGNYLVCIDEVAGQEKNISYIESNGSLPSYSNAMLILANDEELCKLILDEIKGLTLNNFPSPFEDSLKLFFNKFTKQERKDLIDAFIYISNAEAEENPWDFEEEFFLNMLFKLATEQDIESGLYKECRETARYHAKNNSSDEIALCYDSALKILQKFIKTDYFENYKKDSN